MNLTYAELFAGAGGMSIGFETAGWRCVAHAEIEPHARAVLRQRWPDVPLYGDVTKLNGADFRGITLLTGGSPCQDLSVAGKRAGMTEGSGTRSSLFFEQVRIWRESEAPLILWENVYGAFSSNNGRDFAAVLSAIVGAAVAVPADGWRNAGVASGPAGVAAWRTLDAQHFGWDGNTTPQRRRRVFVLGTRAGVCDPAEILLVRDGLLGHLAAGGEAREGIAANTGTGVTRQSLPTGFSTTGSVGYIHDIMPSLPHLTGLNCPGAQMMGVLAAWDDELNHTGQINGTLKARAKSGGTYAGVLTYAAATFDPVNVTSRTNRTRVEVGLPSNTLHSAGMHVLTYDARGNGDGQVVNTLAGDHQNRVTDYTAVVLGTTVSGVDKQQGIPTHNDQVVFTRQRTDEYADGKGVVSTISARDYKSASDVITGSVGIPRRLMPVECERLMGWPDQWTAQGIDEKGREYALSDTARYKLCGNGIASPVTAWIGLRLREVLDSQRAE